MPAIAAAWARERAPSLARMRDTCTLAVFSLMNRRSPIWRFVRPAATRSSTSSSRAVSPKGTAVTSARRLARAGERHRRPGRIRLDGLPPPSPAEVRGALPGRPPQRERLARRPADSSAAAWRHRQ